MAFPDVIPLFPLPNVVLFPHMPLPLHVFEPRYRAMVRAAARGARLIGMALLRGEWQREYLGSPAIFAVGTVGEMVHLEELPDGRYNIVLRGLREYVVRRELADAGTPYRQAVVVPHEVERGPVDAAVRAAIVRLVGRYIERRGGTAERALFAPGIEDEVFVNFFAQHLDLEPLEKQALLEAPSLGERAARLRDVLEFALEGLRVTACGSPHRTH
ncbi:MAG TPA: LON peptidase substrate-binding domain-containing protein [Candidatus Binatia bacterium]|nr:LON peptidase substrate-binding domain-containing protein [Candidatus Binatia bacterium]